MPEEELTEGLRRRIAGTLDPLIARAEPLALLDFPNHPNVGDSLIWLGQRRYLGAAGLGTVYESDQRTYSARYLRRRLGEGTILLTGGGNLGDLWPSFQPFRERVIEDFPRNPIVLLPQTIHFRDPVNLERARRVFDRHPALTVVVRDTRSLAFARENFDVRVALCPDAAVMLDLDRPEVPRAGIVWLARDDHESLGYPRVEADDVGYVDWAGLENEQHTPSFLTRKLPEMEARVPSVARRARQVLGRTFDAIAADRVGRGVDMLAGARVVITDRLHGHILCLLLGIPHVLLDNSYGKVTSFYETWTSSSPLARPANSSEEALQIARELVRGL